MRISSLTLLFIIALANIRFVSTQTKSPRTKTNIYDPVLSSNSYTGRIKENEQIVQIQPRLYASDADPSNTANGKICGYDLSWHKHDDILDDVTRPIPFQVEMSDNGAVLKLKSNSNGLDCEVTATYRLFIRAYDCASNNKRRYSERSSLTITVEDVNEYAPVFTHSQYLFKLHENQTCETISCRVEATDDDCQNVDHRVCGYEILTPDVPFTIDQTGSISITKTLTNDVYVFDVIARDCFPSTDKSKEVSQPARVTFKLIRSCSPSLTDKATTQLTIQSDRIHLFDTINVNTCEETCQIEDIVGTVLLDSHGLDSGCDLQQCSTVDREYVLLPKDNNGEQIPQRQIQTFDGRGQSLMINKTDFDGHFNEQFIIQMWMKHNEDEENNEKHHIFCKSDEKLQNRHHTALFIQNNQLKLLIRKGPVDTNEKTSYASEWIWKLAEITDDQWHLYRFVVNYPEQIDLYVDGKLIVTNKENFQVIQDHALKVIDGTEDTIFVVGACWHARATRMVQHFHGQLSGLIIEQKEELQRSSNCIRDCHQFLDIIDIERNDGLEFVSNSNRSMWMLRTDDKKSYENLLRHLIYRNTFEPLGPHGERTISIQTRVKCVGESISHEMPTFIRKISIESARLPMKVEMKADTNFLVPESVMNQGIYLFRNLSIYTNALKKSRMEISECIVETKPKLTNHEKLIVVEKNNVEKIFNENGAMITGIDSIDTYQDLLRQIAFISKSPVKYLDRTFTLTCTTGQEETNTNEIRVRVIIEKQQAPPAPVAAIQSNRLVVDNDLSEIENLRFGTARNLSDWPVAVVICVSVGLAGVLVLYLVVRLRSNKRQHHPMNSNPDDLHSQMEWEDDIGLNITVNPLDETKKSVPSVGNPHVEQNINAYSGGSSDDDEYENDGPNQNEYSSDDDDDDDYEHNHIHPKKVDHQLEWDDAAIEYGPKKV